MLKVAIIGLGTIAPIHHYAISHNDKAKLVCVCDTDKSKENMYKDVNFYTDIDEMIEKEELDCVHICLPHFLHSSTIEKFAKNKINVFCEKPVALTYDEASKIFDIEEKYSVKVGICLQNRYNTTSVKLKEIATKKENGKFLGSKGIVTWSRKMDYYNQASWRGVMSLSGGGVMINQTIHTLDLLYYICGEFSEVEAKVANFTLKQTEIEDSVMAYLKYKNNGTAIFFSTIGYETNSSIEVEVVFENVTYKINNNKLYEVCNKTGEEIFICEDQKLSGSKHYYGASHAVVIEEFYKSIINNSNEYVNLKEGAYSLKLIESIKKSNEQNKVVEV